MRFKTWKMILAALFFICIFGSEKILSGYNTQMVQSNDQNSKLNHSNLITKIENLKFLGEGEVESDLDDGAINVKNYISKNANGYWDNAINEAMLENPKAVIYFPDGDYKVGSTIKITKDNCFKLSKNARIYTDFQLDSLIEYNTERTINSIYDLSKDRFIIGGTLDGNNKVKDVLRLSNYLHFTLRDTELKNAKERGLVTRYTGNLSAELVASNLYFINDLGINYGSVGINNTGNDNHFEDVFIVDFETAVHDQGFTFMSRVHPWISKKELVANSVGFKITGLTIMDNCYPDTFKYSFIVENGSLLVSNSHVFFNTAVYSKDIETSNPAIVFKNTNGNIKCNSISIYSDLIKTKIIDNINDNSYFYNSFLNGTTTWENLSDKQFINSTNNAIPKVYKYPGMEMTYNGVTKGYIATSPDAIYLSNKAGNIKIGVFDDGTVKINDNILNPTLFGNSNSKPVNPTIGQCYFDIQKGLPLWWNGSSWVKSDGMLP